MGETKFSVVAVNHGSFADAEMLTQIIRKAEELGYYGVWFADHLVIPNYAKGIYPPSFYESLSLCGFGLGMTERLRFGTDVLVLPYRHPLQLAKVASTLDRLSGGRLILGVGVGFMRGEFEALGVPVEHRGAITDEYLSAIRALWESDGPVSFDGKFVQFSDVLFEPRPSNRVPLFVGGNSAAGRRRAAELGDGWHPLWPTPEQYARARDSILQRRRELGLTGAFTFSYSCFLTRLVDEEPEWTPPDPAVSITDFLPEEFRYSPPPPMTPNGRPFFHGTPDHVAADIEALREVGVEHFLLRFSFGAGDIDLDGFVGQMERFAREIAPRFSSP